MALVDTKLIKELNFKHMVTTLAAVASKICKLHFIMRDRSSVDMGAV